MKNRPDRGFTLVEILVVLGIISILAGIAVPAYNGYTQKAKKAAVMQD
ncbi:MAG TPA: prepilin-type N-terminal cleavage/methylation domain-containing protein, partial [Candidatus Binatia bacterium]